MKDIFDPFPLNFQSDFEPSLAINARPQNPSSSFKKSTKFAESHYKFTNQRQ